MSGHVWYTQRKQVLLNCLICFRSRSGSMLTFGQRGQRSSTLTPNANGKEMRHFRSTCFRWIRQEIRVLTTTSLCPFPQAIINAVLPKLLILGSEWWYVESRTHGSYSDDLCTATVTKLANRRKLEISRENPSDAIWECALTKNGVRTNRGMVSICCCALSEVHTKLRIPVF